VQDHCVSLSAQLPPLEMVGCCSQDFQGLFAIGTASLKPPLPENCRLLLLLLLKLLLLLLLLLCAHRRSRPRACHPQRPAALCGDLSPPAGSTAPMEHAHTKRQCTRSRTLSSNCTLAHAGIARDMLCLDMTASAASNVTPANHMLPLLHSLRLCYINQQSLPPAGPAAGRLLPSLCPAQ
jgi:hypothetical protein